MQHKRGRLFERRCVALRVGDGCCDHIEWWKMTQRDGWTQTMKTGISNPLNNKADTQKVAQGQVAR
jgi:hypothetical protein